MLSLLPSWVNDALKGMVIVVPECTKTSACNGARRREKKESWKEIEGEREKGNMRWDRLNK